MLYNFFGKNGKELKKLKDMKKDDTIRNLLETKYDRETIAVLLGISKDEIPEIMHRCNYSDAFIQTANDLQGTAFALRKDAGLDSVLQSYGWFG